MGFLSSDSLALHNTDALPLLQGDERRCIRAHVAGDVPVDETCATYVDRFQDEIDRRADGLNIPQALADRMQANYGRTGPKGGTR
ncbi:hypothetical protein GCM10011583_18600 [Streptomyces camponoticapitis]|uniref:Uncharacterized protein n=1 Tax=Streptomyces camponoticapitis TaxID=1616125 RepID=A0ABQ2E5U1_9ACTN|nr:hypothetical protein [Streptomyces camponoticapitis]GGJ87348.1 hypothetical protein GCM10011583_18600 [Streptomyces camponoticapitis]